MKKSTYIILSIIFCVLLIFSLSACDMFSSSGKSAYDIAVEYGFEGTEQEWLESLKGDKGDPGINGEAGSDGLSAYEIEVKNGYQGSEQEWIDEIKGIKGDTGAKGDDGLSAYEVAVENGFEGTVNQWLESLEGAKGDSGAKGNEGLSAYQVALENGFVGTEEQWLESLKGEKGDIGASYEEDNRTESVHKALKSSVLIASISTTNSLVGGAGSGVIFADDKASGTAYIITNFHVVYNTTEDKLFDKFMVFLYGQSYPVNYLDIGTDVYSSNVGIWAICIGYEPTQDIAVLKIENSNYYRDSIAEPAEISVFDTYVGDGCFAIGNPLGEGFSVTHGIISLESKYKAGYRIEDTDLPVEERRIILQRSIRHNCAINQGNSGGGLFNNDGKLIGINNKGELTYSDGAGNIIVVNGIVYAIPLEIAVGFAQEIIDNYNGVDIYEVSINNIDNYLTLQISDSYATYDEITKRVSVEEEIEVSQVKDEVGNPFKDELKAGDILLSFSYQKNGQTYNIDIDRYYIAAECLYFLDEGDTITFTVLRNNIETTVEVTL